MIISNLLHPGPFLFISMGILTGFIGLLSTLAALNAFADTCFRSLDSNLTNLSLTKTPGPAFVMLLVANVLKIIDIGAHIIVPVPKDNYWSPSEAKDTVSDENL